MGSRYLNKSQASFLVVIVVLVSVSLLYIPLYAAWYGKKYSRLSNEDKTVLKLMLTNMTNPAESKSASIKYIVEKAPGLPLNSPIFYNNRALLNQAMNYHKDDYCSDFSKAIELGYDSAARYANRAGCN